MTKKQQLIEGVKGMEDQDAVCYCKTHPEHNCGITSNQALTDVLTLIEKVYD